MARGHDFVFDGRAKPQLDAPYVLTTNSRVRDRYGFECATAFEFHACGRIFFARLHCQYSSSNFLGQPVVHERDPIDDSLLRRR
jgi:hypothetical protein